MTSVGVVLIAKNQAATIGRLVESVRREVDTGTDIVLVDSASEDETVARARRHPIRILRLSTAERLTPAAGRYVGFHATSGDAVLFLDGDMELCPGWLTASVGVLASDPRVAAVSGRLLEVGNVACPSPSTPRRGGRPHVIDVRHVGGAALFRRAALDEVGPFNPYLHSEEEPELCLRLRRAGYRIVELDRPIAVHHGADNKLAALLDRRRRKFFLGHGQAMRYLRRERLLRRYLRERGFALVPAAVAATTAAVVVSAFVSRRPAYAAAWGALLLAFVGGDCLRKRSVRRTGVSLLVRLLLLEGMVRGLLVEPRDARSYRSVAEVVQ